MFLVVWTDCYDGDVGKQPVFADHWLAFETYLEAEESYKKLNSFDEIHSVSLCGCILSTDFEGTGEESERDR